jgi:hypothetical protein
LEQFIKDGSVFLIKLSHGRYRFTPNWFQVNEFNHKTLKEFSDCFYDNMTPEEQEMLSELMAKFIITRKDTVEEMAFHIEDEGLDE